MLEQGIADAIKLAQKKKQILDINPIQYFVRALLAGIYIGFIIVLCFKLGFFHVVNSPATYLSASLFLELHLY